MANLNETLVIDIGSESLKATEFSYPQEGGMRIENFAFIEYSNDESDDDIFNSLGIHLKTLVEENDFTAKDVNISVSGQSAFVRSVKLPIVGDDLSQIKQMVEYEAQQTVPFPIEEVVWDYQLIKGEEEDSETEVVFVVVKNDIIEQITNAIESVGKSVKAIEVSPTASYNAARANGIGEEECSLILNIGGKCSTLVFIDGNRFYVRSIPIAGNTITHQISKEFGISFNDAEEMKRRHGFVALGGAYEEPDSEVAATVSKIVRNVMTRLHGEINRSVNVYRSQQKGKKPQKLFLSGGSSVMAFTPRFFSDKLRIPVEYFNPFQVVSLSEDIDKEYLAEVAHMFSEMIGLGLRVMTVCPVEISLVPEDVKKAQDLKKKTPFFYASAASLLLCLGIVYWGVDRRTGKEVQIQQNSQQIVETAEAYKSKIDKLLIEKANINEKYQVAVDIIKKRKDLPELMNKIQSLIPNSMWLTTLNLSNSSSSEAKKVRVAPVRTRGSRFGRSRGSRAATKPTTKTSANVTQISWINMEGHSLYPANSQNVIYFQEFKDNLKNSGLCSEFSENQKFAKEVQGNNISEFKLSAKLTQPIKK